MSSSANSAPAATSGHSAHQDSKGSGPGIHESGDQRGRSESDDAQPTRYDEGQKNSHLANDSKDQRTIANRLAAEEKKSELEEDPEVAMAKKDPTLPAKSHNNKPSRGAEIDAEIMEEEAEYLKRKGKA